MKRILFLIITLVGVLSCGVTRKQADVAEFGSYTELLSSILQKCEASNDADNYLESVAELKRLEAMFPGESWLTDYYLALYEIQMSVGKKDGNDAVMKEAMERVSKLKADKTADFSEVMTLEGYYYYALISADSANNGRAYYKSVIDSYNRALTANPNNPRASLLLTVFSLNMSQTTGTKVNVEGLPETIKKIEAALGAEDILSVNPHWGKSTLDNLKNYLETYL